LRKESRRPIDDPVRDLATFSANHEPLFNEDLARVFFERVKHTAGWAKLTSDERFSVDGTLIQARAAHKCFKRKAATAAHRPGATPR
jgi:transposase